jgi:GNAT superfamily N-acetyltransferase
MSLNYTFANSLNDLHSILSLQKKNLSAALSNEEINDQGFVTVDHSFEQLASLNKYEKHIICKDGEKVVAYLLAMTIDSKNDIPVLVPMFEQFNALQLEGRPLSDYHYIVVGQVCVDKSYRGMGILDKCYDAYKEAFRDKYAFAITEIANRNTRSLKAHARIGFKELSRFLGPDDEEWVIVFWKLGRRQ